MSLDLDPPFAEACRIADGWFDVDALKALTDVDGALAMRDLMAGVDPLNISALVAFVLTLEGFDARLHEAMLTRLAFTCTLAGMLAERDR